MYPIAVRVSRVSWLRRLAPYALLTLVLFLLPSQLSAQTDAREIVDRVDRLLRGRSSRGTMRMDVVTAHWSRSMQMRIWSLGTEYALIRLLAPPKDAGTATLKSGEDMWNYLPRVDRTIKLPASLMGASWMGSHFTNDDLVKESRIIEDYDIEIGYEGARNGVEVWEFVLTPKPEAAVVWGRIEEQVRQGDLMPVWARYYDDRGELARSITFEDFRSMGGRLVPARMVIRPADKPTESTTITYLDLEFDIALDASFFSLRRLQSDRGSD
ncbi:MAG: outer membrane lipoprotein-sorting protein [Gemmatimonadota bacterium]|nr:outer membrane lipoprotein-sorting protein [Gemmatimonadota bacterium]MDH3367658.1 outer membrane lipoprotein-sorting protein [Gemmatimonadota bacterium]MDH3476672.1 outer membrane lipoprotein-sorting protein [Gemmatimonadota bacterium]MDH3570454.1 outer membrane lipoprotein-sorting protein [Gemmatimonadota bacterium]MDH5550982.1 outer membrane lipoprotein-sorting protein [Gemmatimonadota bacterium]